MLENLRLIECHHSPQGANGSGERSREMNRINSKIDVNDGNMHQLLWRQKGGLSYKPMRETEWR